MPSDPAPTKRHIEPADILLPQDYAAARKDSRTRIAALKKTRRVEVGPFATFYFENWETIRHQIQEMLYIEKAGSEQIADEIAAYAPLVPNGGNLVATVMFEIENAARRATALHAIGGIENHAFMQVGGETLRGQPDPERENTSPDGKASSVQFFHFDLPATAAAAFKAGVVPITLGFDHPNYGHVATVPEAVRAALAGDLD